VSAVLVALVASGFSASCTFFLSMLMLDGGRLLTV
jgi:ABC-type uncharacterized transport system YnjBCD permease subunit